MNEVDLRADEGLQKLGYEQQMKRSRNVWHILFMTLAIMAVPFGLSTPIATSLVAGGPAVIFWGFILVSVLTLTTALSLAEIIAKYPTSAGAYYWCFQLASPRYRLLLSWINGWLTLVGDWTVSLSVCFGTAQLLVAGIGIFHPDWVATAWQTYLIFMGITLVATAIGIFFNRALPALDVLFAIWLVLGTIVMLVCLSAKADVGRKPASFALGFFDPSGSGWTPGWSFFIGLLPVPYTYSAICMISSMAEEVHNPTVDLPRAMAWQVPIGMLSGIFFLLPILFTLPDIETLLEVPGGQPLGVMYTLIMGTRGGGFGMWFIIFGVGIFCAISISCAASRATWAFARDKALPFHRAFSHVHSSGTPLNAYLLSTTIQLLLGLIYLGSSTAFNAFVGVAVICLGASNGMTILISLMNGRKDMVDSPFPLGKWGVPLNTIAVLWVMFEIVLFCMPAVVPVTRVTMNYASVVFVGFGVISAGWYLISGRYHYAGPPQPFFDEPGPVKEGVNSLSDDSGLEEKTKNQKSS
ncbi:hypothetical protein Moror_16074 [Moniliophthora roreri MCA 2997]|uniref:Amino acid transporter n=1 Tax=Moniliophthora roreri (strain MCA 2997) TaxID=1381753 RepID=V2XAJ0_MONRO|nr:hypothetical protein Moror_16074 [Moniliophthora roreri MCA 2997]